MSQDASLPFAKFLLSFSPFHNFLAFITKRPVVMVHGIVPDLFGNWITAFVTIKIIPHLPRLRFLHRPLHTGYRFHPHTGQNFPHLPLQQRHSPAPYSQSAVHLVSFQTGCRMISIAALLTSLLLRFGTRYATTNGFFSSSKVYVPFI